MLVNRFGSIGAIIEAPGAALRRALPSHIQAAEAIISARQFTLIGQSEDLRGTAVKVDDPELHSYLIAKLQNRSEERMQAIYLDANGLFISDETIVTGAVDAVALSTRKLIHHALDCGARALLLAHNHPSGQISPSETDRITTRRIAEISAALQIVLVDHLIVARSKLYSIRRGTAL